MSPYPEGVEMKNREEKDDRRNNRVAYSRIGYPRRIPCRVCTYLPCPGVFIAGAIAAFVKKKAILKCFGPDAKKKIESPGIKADFKVIATDYGIKKSGTDKPSYSEIETLLSAVKRALEKTRPEI